MIKLEHTLIISIRINGCLSNHEHQSVIKTEFMKHTIDLGKLRLYEKMKICYNREENVLFIILNHIYSDPDKVFNLVTDIITITKKFFKQKKVKIFGSSFIMNNNIIIGKQVKEKDMFISSSIYRTTYHTKTFCSLITNKCCKIEINMPFYMDTSDINSLKSDIYHICMETQSKLNLQYKFLKHE